MGKEVIKKFYMINNTDSIYSQLVPLEYPKVGESPSACKVGVVNISDAKTTWMDVPGDPSQNYLVRMEFIPTTNKLLIQQLNRKQNKSKLYIADALNGSTKVIQEELIKLGNEFKRYSTRWEKLSKNIKTVNNSVEDISKTSVKIGKRFDAISKVQLDDTDEIEENIDN